MQQLSSMHQNCLVVRGTGGLFGGVAASRTELGTVVGDCFGSCWL